MSSTAPGLGWPLGDDPTAAAGLGWPPPARSIPDGSPTTTPDTEADA